MLGVTVIYKINSEFLECQLATSPCALLNLELILERPLHSAMYYCYDDEYPRALNSTINFRAMIFFGMECPLAVTTPTRLNISVTSQVGPLGDPQDHKESAETIQLDSVHALQNSHNNLH